MTDIVDDIFLLSTLVMKGHVKGCERLEDSLYVDLGVTRHTNVQVREIQVYDVSDQAEDLFSWSWHAGFVGTLIESVNNEKNVTLGWDREHFFQAFSQDAAIWHQGAIIVCRI